MKVSTLSAFVANTAVMFAVVIVFTLGVLLGVDEVVLPKQDLDWQFREVTKNNATVFQSFQRSSETTDYCFDNKYDRKSFFDEFQLQNTSKFNCFSAKN